KFKSAVYPKPDAITGSFELRRITTQYAALEEGRDKRADFFEFYWAHLMTGNTVAGVVSWVAGLLFRRPARVPPRLRGHWILGLALFGAVAALILLAGARQWAPPVFSALGLPPLPSWAFLAAGVATAIFGAVATAWVAPVAGDAARYLSPTPNNVAARQSIREAGVDLLQKLQATGDYDRIVLVCHSLGCVVGYDILRHAWGQLDKRSLQGAHPAGGPALEALARLEVAAGKLRHAKPAERGKARADYRSAQRAYFSALASERGKPSPWLVSDFVTMGSPLSKADVLIARDPKELEDKKSHREVPSSPPWLEVDRPSRSVYRFSYPTDASVRIPHHAAVFGPVVWTNLYYENPMLLLGDLVAGPTAPYLGRGVLDVRLEMGPPAFRHLDYWKDPAAQPPGDWLKALRRAVNLRMLSEADLWGEQATAVEVDAKRLPDA
ncbi:MAG TPA: hypothetical protein VD906_12440, partial [Caulobacteraceae bacterium]|nr:hypothetical protein [Caulobacteraceae bacterium]